jgi:hypothetical protein
MFQLLLVIKMLIFEKIIKQSIFYLFKIHKANIIILIYLYSNT